MNSERKRQLRMDAHMDGQRAIVASIGKKVSLSQMELICLVNFAEIGLMSIFSSLDGVAGEEAEQSLEQHLDRIRAEFGKDGNDDGLNRLSASTAAMLRGRKFAEYLA